MKIDRKDNLGDFDAKGNLKSPAEILVRLYDMTLDEYQRMDMLLTDYLPEIPVVPPQLRKLRVIANDPVHAGENPTSGGPAK
jgi:hypothetical protein